MPTDPKKKTAPAIDEETLRFLDEQTVELSLTEETRRQLQILERQPIDVQWAAVTHPGKVRPHNEDHYLAVRRRVEHSMLSTNLTDGVTLRPPEENFIFAVADGLGGHSYGELASALALQHVRDNGRDSWLVELAECEPAEVLKRAHSSVLDVHHRLLDEARRNPELRGMASTLTAALIFRRRLIFIHLGDSRAYLFRAGQLDQITQDHTLASEIRSSRMLDVRAVRMANVLTNCLGGDDGKIRVETHDLRWMPGDQLLLCSDGLSDLVKPAELADELARNSPDAACQKLLDLALERGGRDNITIIVARFVPPRIATDP